MVAYIIFLLLLIAISLTPSVILFTPIRIKLLAEKKGLEARGEINIALTGEATRIRVNLTEKTLEVYFFGVRILRKSIEEKKKREEKKREEKKRVKEKFRFRVEYIRPILRFIYNAMKTFSIKKFYLRLNLGLENAYETGIACGYLYPMVYPLNTFQNTCIRITPNFDAPMLDGRLEVDIENKVVRLIPPAFNLTSDLKLKGKILRKIKDVL